MRALEAADIRVVADDLTGALDSAVSFASRGNGIGVSWRLDRAFAGRMAIDAATREGSLATAVERHRTLAPWLAGGQLSFKKIDSLLRGHVIAEIEACIVEGAYQHVVLAPAFPFQGRATRLGRQWRLDRSEVVGPDLVAGLGRRFPAGRSTPGPRPVDFITLYDAETDADLDRVVAAVPKGSTLWVGTGGLAAALARHMNAPPKPAPAFSAPFVALVGTNHEVTANQVALFSSTHAGGHIVVDGDIEGAKTHLTKRMTRGEPSVVSVAASGDRHVVADHIGKVFASLLEGLPKPGTLLVTGGETLRSVCDSLRAIELTVECEIEPGLPVSRITGGVFDGLVAISKSGAFGDHALLCRLAALACR
ncbi:four-carbon acid sugar kinase family protein [Mesorhizobium sp. WSM4935]|uniref:four-carbon acid sugar kinase family protein n=1 Tax=Mesorhizobium sp. WSM4935 TaxID=3038547 RepID=UPI0005960CE3|nr:four-carbon acid sugar kinase family protein [Mesorhizobium sp. WSM4935]MDG4876262.1 four-carbon acid sugar kinase family protein [Mesorhizobium sp. WSM4935]